MQRYGPGVGLVVVDVQNDFADPDGSLAVNGGTVVIPAINREISLARTSGAIVAYSQDWHPANTPHFAKDGGTWPAHCVAGTWGADLHPELAIEDDAPRIRKGANGEDGYSAFAMRDPVTGETVATALEELLREHAVASVVVVGLATDYCVKATALDAARLGFATTFLRECAAAVDLRPGDGAAAVRDMADAGVRIDSVLDR